MLPTISGPNTSTYNITSAHTTADFVATDDIASANNVGTNEL